MNLFIRIHDIYISSPNCSADGFCHSQGAMYLSTAWHGARRGMDIATREGSRRTRSRGPAQSTKQILCPRRSYHSPRLNHGLHAIDATPARWRGDAVLRPRDLTSTATLSPRNDSAKNYAPGSLIDLRTGPASAATNSRSRI
jgi:hypothetical protein